MIAAKNYNNMLCAPADSPYSSYYLFALPGAKMVDGRKKRYTLAVGCGYKLNVCEYENHEMCELVGRVPRFSGDWYFFTIWMNIIAFAALVCASLSSITTWRSWGHIALCCCVTVGIYAITHASIQRTRADELKEIKDPRARRIYMIEC